MIETLEPLAGDLPPASSHCAATPNCCGQVRVDEEQELDTIAWPGGADMDPDVPRGVEPPAE